MHIKAAILTALLLTTSAALATPPPDYDFQWSTISDPGNPGYFGVFDANVARLGRGDVDYEYRMSRFEVSASQWVEFINTFAPDDADFARDHGRITSWGVFNDPEYNGPGRRYVLRTDIDNAGRMPVSSVSFRTAALYCNWLHHGKPSDLAQIQSGAYDTSTWGGSTTDGFTDQILPSPGAKFWIPTPSEWLKAVYWDPNKNGPGEGGWWENQYLSDDRPTPGYPGDPGAQTSAGIDLGPVGAMSIPLGAYPDAMSPWGLFDTSGGTQELLSGWFDVTDTQTLIAVGGEKAGQDNQLFRDFIWGLGSTGGPDFGFSTVGLRIASAVPAPSSVLILCGGTALICSTRRNRACTEKPKGRSSPWPALPRTRTAQSSSRNSKPAGGLTTRAA